MKIYELLAEAGQETPQQAAPRRPMPRVLRTGGTANSMPRLHALRVLPLVDKPSALFLGRAKAFVSNPPGPDWEPVNALEGQIGRRQSALAQS